MARGRSERQPGLLGRRELRNVPRQARCSVTPMLCIKATNKARMRKSGTQTVTKIHRRISAFARPSFSSTPAMASRIWASPPLTAWPWVAPSEVVGPSSGCHSLMAFMTAIAATVACLGEKPPVRSFCANLCVSKEFVCMELRSRELGGRVIGMESALHGACHPTVSLNTHGVAVR